MKNLYVLTMLLFSYMTLQASNPQLQRIPSTETITLSRSTTSQSVVTTQPYIPNIPQIPQRPEPLSCCQILQQTAETFGQDCCPPENYNIRPLEFKDYPCCLRLCAEHPERHRDVRECRQCCVMTTIVTCGCACVIGTSVTCAVIIPKYGHW